MNDLLMAAGALAEKFGTRRVFLTGLWVSVTFSFALVLRRHASERVLFAVVNVDCIRRVSAFVFLAWNRFSRQSKIINRNSS